MPTRTMPSRVLRPAALLAVAALLLVPVPARGTRPPAAPRAGQPAHIVALAREAMRRDDLHAVILSVWTGDRQLVQAALGQSSTSQPATTDTHFRIGAIAIPYLATVLLQLAELIREGILTPLGLDNTGSPATPVVRAPVLHVYDSERGVYEDSTYWNPSWTLASGAIMTSDITDVAKTAIAAGSGALPSRQSCRLMIKPRSLLTPPGAPRLYFGMGVVLDHSWVIQTPLFAGYNAAMAYLPAKKIAIAVTTTPGPKASPSTNYSTQLMAAIGRYLVPKHPPFS